VSKPHKDPNKAERESELALNIYLTKMRTKARAMRHTRRAELKGPLSAIFAAQSTRPISYFKELKQTPQEVEEELRQIRKDLRQIRKKENDENNENELSKMMRELSIGASNPNPSPNPSPTNVHHGLPHVYNSPKYTEPRGSPYHVHSISDPLI
jgi:hypothetical protein